MFLVIRKRDHGCYECGGETITHVFATENKELADSWVESANTEIEAARVAYRERFSRPEDNSVVNHTNYLDWMKKILILDAEYFSETLRFSDVDDIDYEVVEVGVR